MYSIEALYIILQYVQYIRTFPPYPSCIFTRLHVRTVRKCILLVYGKEYQYVSTLFYITNTV